MSNAFASRCLGFLLLATCCFQLTGCGSSESESRTVNASEGDNDSDRERAKEQWVLSHDFGVIRPGQKVTHKFTIRNPSETRWTFAEFQTSCSCTVSDASRPFIEPGGSEEVDVTYNASSENGDASYRVGVRFQERKAPFGSLAISARVREPVCPSPKALDFKRIGQGSTPEDSFEIQNYFEQDIKVLAVKPFPAWLEANHVFVGAMDKPNHPRQVWRVVVKAKTDGLPSGKHDGHVLIETDCPDAPKRIVPVTIYVSAPVEAVPGQMFLGTVPRGMPTSTTISLRFAPDVLPSSTEDLVLKHDLGDRLILSCKQISPELWRLTATLTPPANTADEALIEGEVRVEFRHAKLPALQIPVYARVRK